MTEAGTHIGSGGPVPLPRSLPSGTERAAYRGPEERLARLHAYFLEGCTDEIRPVLESVLADARRVHAGYGDDRGRRRARLGLVRGDGDRGAGRRARARRGRRSRRGGSDRGGVRAAAVRGAVRALPRGRRKPAAARAPSTRRDRAPARPPDRARRPRRRHPVDADAKRARVHRHDRRRRTPEPARASRGEGDTPRSLPSLAARRIAASRRAGTSVR